MAAQYLLECTCGERHSVETRQAGTTISCQCGKTLEVPTLRGLKELPQKEVKSDAPPAEWTLRQGIVTAGVIVALILFGAGIVPWRHERAFQQSQDSLEDTAPLITAMETDVEKMLDQSPLKAWQFWQYSYKPSIESGFIELTASAKAGLGEAIRAKRTERWVWWGAAAIVLVAALSWAKFAPRS